MESRGGYPSEIKNALDFAREHFKITNEELKEILHFVGEYIKHDFYVERAQAPFYHHGTDVMLTQHIVKDICAAYRIAKNRGHWDMPGYDREVLMLGATFHDNHPFPWQKMKSEKAYLNDLRQQLRVAKRTGNVEALRVIQEKVDEAKFVFKVQTEHGMRHPLDAIGMSFRYFPEVFHRFEKEGKLEKFLYLLIHHMQPYPIMKYELTSERKPTEECLSHFPNQVEMAMLPENMQEIISKETHNGISVPFMPLICNTSTPKTSLLKLEGDEANDFRTADKSNAKTEVLKQDGSSLLHNVGVTLGNGISFLSFVNPNIEDNLTTHDLYESFTHVMVPVSKKRKH